VLQKSIWREQYLLLVTVDRCSCHFLLTRIELLNMIKAKKFGFKKGENGMTPREGVDHYIVFPLFVLDYI